MQASADGRDFASLAALTVEPTSIEELVLGVDARIRRGDTATARELVTRYAKRLSVTESQVLEMTTRIATEEGLRTK